MIFFILEYDIKNVSSKKSDCTLDGMVTDIFKSAFPEAFKPIYDVMFLALFIIFMLNLLMFIVTALRKKKIRDKINDLTNHTIAISPKEFFKIRNQSFGGRGRPLYSNKFSFTGVYILHNQSKDLYYIGQGKNVFNRVNAHFTGKGNGDVYADYKYDDEFSIRMIALEGSGYKSLNDLERHMIETYNAYKKGYNRNRGNKSFV